MSALADANRVVNELSSTGSPEPRESSLSYLFVRQEALSSSRMEGTWSTLDDVLTPADDGFEKSDTASIKSYAIALERVYSTVLTEGVPALTTDMVRNLHAALMSRDPSYDGVPGELRRPDMEGSVVWIGGGGRPENSLYNPCPPAHVEAALKTVMEWYGDPNLVEVGDAGLGLPLPLRIAIGHVHFEAVHPFRDGNGRVGRMLWPLQMVASGLLPLYLSGFVESEREDYSRTLNRAQVKLDYGPFTEFISVAFAKSFQEKSVTKQAIEGLPEEWRKRGKFRKGSTADRILEVLLSEPVADVGHVMKKLSVSKPAATAALASLLESGIVVERTGKKRNRVYAAEEVISVLSRPFGTSPRASLERARKRLNC